MEMGGSSSECAWYLSSADPVKSIICFEADSLKSSPGSKYLLLPVSEILVMLLNML